MSDSFNLEIFSPHSYFSNIFMNIFQLHISLWLNAVISFIKHLKEKSLKTMSTNV